jgi:hypothetical protein
MNKKIVVLSVVGLIAFIGLMLLFMSIGYSNSEIRLRNTINAKMQDNQSEFDNMWKKISQIAQVTKKERESLSQLFNDYAKARTGNGNGGELMKWVQESIPNVSPQTYLNLQNIIVASRDSWTFRQKELIDLKREHDNLRLLFPSSLFVGKRPEILITIITSTKTKETFKTGEDNDVNLEL